MNCYFPIYEQKVFMNKVNTGKQITKSYSNTLEKIENPLPLLADYPEYVEPLQYEYRYLAPPVVHEESGQLLVRSWRYWYKARVAALWRWRTA